MNMKKCAGMFTSKTDEWATPKEFFKELDRQYHFTVDVCADRTNARCDKYYTQRTNGLLQDWTGETVWCNPPYSDVRAWAYKCLHSNARVCVMLVPARTDTKWFHDFCYGRAELVFIKGRLKFGDSTNSAPFPSMLVIWKGEL